MKLVIATGNAHKLSEIRSYLGEEFEIQGLKDIGFEGEIIEDGATFEENAAIKARAVAEKTDLPVLADDSGLIVDALDGAPGIYSARFGGEDGNHALNNERLLKELAGVTEDARTARFVCVLAFLRPSGEVEYFTGQAEGRILETYSGSQGFGYDPLFFSYDLNKAFAEASESEKNKVSHRGRALLDFRARIEQESFRN